MSKHRLTKAQREHLKWHKQIEPATAVRHKSADGKMTPWEATTTVLIREGYLEASEPNQHGNRRLTLTQKGATAA